MIDTFLMGLDELYHRAKFGEIEQRRCENVVFVCFYRQNVAKRPTAGIKLLTGQKSGF